MTRISQEPLSAELVAVLTAVTQGEPRVLTTSKGIALPAGPFQMAHRSLQGGLRAWVASQTQHAIGYVEQLYTFADRDRPDLAEGQRVVYISYLGLTRERLSVVPQKKTTSDVVHAAVTTEDGQGGWQNWYRYFPWEDRRNATSADLPKTIKKCLTAWQAQAPTAAAKRERRARVAMTFGMDDFPWNEELVLQRYELLFEAGGVAEAGVHGLPLSPHQAPGTPMQHDFRRMLATGMARLRAKIKYRPVVFELMPPEFTLLQLQHTVEALAGRNLHKQNFRRLIEQQALVEDTGSTTAASAGRPAKLFRFKSTVVLERTITGTKLPLIRQV